jgi:prolyl-tRNA synthetase
VDDREGFTPGNKFFHWEQRGIPVTIELGPRDLEQGVVVVKRRDTGGKEPVAQDAVGGYVTGLLERMQGEMFARARQRLKDNTVVANSFEEVREILEPVSAERGGGKFVMAHLKDDPGCDAQIKALKATVRCIPLTDEFDGPGRCILTGETVPQRVVIAKAY